MNVNYFHVSIGIIFCMLVCIAPTAHPAGCHEIKKTCTQDVRFEKTIEGHAYNCYECSQTVCKTGVSGSIAWVEISMNCESIGPIRRILADQHNTTHFDEADAVLGKRTEVKDAHHPVTTSHSVHRKTNHSKTIDHRKFESSAINKSRERSTKKPEANSFKAPSQVTLYDVTSSQLSISWMDNANNEYGVSVERGTPKEDRGGINYDWQHVFNVEERIDSNVKGTGWRTDGDDGLSSNTEDCYRLRAYHKKQYSDYSATVCTSTKQIP